MWFPVQTVSTILSLAVLFPTLWMVERATTALNKHFATQLRLQHGYMLTPEAVEIALTAALEARKEC